MRTKIDTRDFRAFEQELKKLPNNLATRALQAATTAAMRRGLKEIKASAPVGTEPSWSKTGEVPANEKYGKLRDNIKLQSVKPQDKFSRSARITTGKAFWGVFQELGTRHMPAKPWFGPAFKRAVPAIVDALGKELAKHIDRAWKKAGK